MSCCRANKFKLTAYVCFLLKLKCADKNNQIKIELARSLGRFTSMRFAVTRERLLLLSAGQELHLLGETPSFFATLLSGLLPWLDGAVDFWVLSLAELCVEAEDEAAVGWGGTLEDLEACAGFEVELEGCLRRLPSSPAEDDGYLLLPPSSPIGGCG